MIRYYDEQKTYWAVLKEGCLREEVFYIRILSRVAGLGSPPRKEEWQRDSKREKS
jgi:hypothetical protein